MYFIDVKYGIAGDMIAAAFIDLNKSLKIVDNRKILSVLVKSANVMTDTIVNIDSNASGTLLTVNTQPLSATALDMRNYLKDALSAVNLSSSASQFAYKILDTILYAEAEAHGQSIKELVLHETGSADTIVDIVCIAYFYDLLKLNTEKIYANPIAVGKGKIKIQHGIFKVPPPATTIILNGLKWFYGPYDGEMATPTGVAILKNLITGQNDFWMHLKGRVGIGFGTRKFKNQTARTFVKVVMV
jgi:hypothetical protein